MAHKILIIDDEAAVRFTIEHVLTDAGFEIRTAGDGKEGMRMVGGFHPDLVITDMIMPEKEGMETIMELRAKHPATKIIAITGGGRTGNADLLEMAKMLGADGTLAKPFETDELTEMVRQSLAH